MTKLGKMGKIRLPRGSVGIAPGAGLRRSCGFLCPFKNWGGRGLAPPSPKKPRPPRFTAERPLSLFRCAHTTSFRSPAAGPVLSGTDSGRWRLGSAVPVTGGGRRLKLWDVGIWRGRPVNL